MAVGTAKVDVRLNDGRAFQAAVEHARGSLSRPLTDDELEQKLVSLAAYGCPKLDAVPLVDAIWSIEDMSDVSDVMRCAMPAS